MITFTTTTTQPLALFFSLLRFLSGWGGGVHAALTAPLNRHPGVVDALADGFDALQREPPAREEALDAGRADAQVLRNPGVGDLLLPQHLNGASLANDAYVAALLGNPGDRLTIMSYALVDEKSAPDWQPRVIVLGEKNVIVNERGI